MAEQLACLKGKGIDAVILGPLAKNPSDSVHRVFHGNDHLPRLVYVTPEYLIGVDEQAIGCIEMLRESADKLALIVIDECHKIFERSGSFR